MVERLICADCGNHDDFSKVVYGKKNFSEIELVNRYGETIDYVDYEETDTEILDEEDLICERCSGKNILSFVEEDYYDYVSRHLDKKFEWSKDELPINKEFLARIIAERV